MQLDPALAAVLDTLDDAAVLLRSAGEPALVEIVHATRRNEAFFGVDPRTLAGRSLRALRLLGMRPEELRRLRCACARGEPFDAELSLRTASGARRRFRLRGEPAPAPVELYVLWLRPIPLREARSLSLERASRLSGGWWYLQELGADGRLQLSYLDPELCRRLGLGPETGQELRDRLLSEDETAWRQHIQRLLGGRASDVEYRLLPPEGEPLVVEDRAEPLLDEQGLVTGVIGVLRPREERLVLEGRLGRDAAALLARLLHALTFVLREDGTLLWVSDEPATPLARHLGALVGRDLATALPAAIVDRWLDLADRALAGEETIVAEMPVPLADSEGSYEVTAAPLGRRCVLFTLRPGEAARRGPLALAEARPPPYEAPPAEILTPARQQEVWMLAVLGAVADGIVATDRRGLVRWLNEAAEVIFGYGADEITGRPFHLLLAATGERAFDFEALRRQLDREPVGYMEISGRRRDGEVIPLEICVAPIDVPPGGYAITVRDITVRRQTEEAIRALAYYDPLTALPNRLLFVDRLGDAVERARRNRQMFAVMLVDLDRFKLINDSLGLQIGDAMLRAVGERLRRTLRKSDTVARLGGDEFMILLHGVGSAEAAARVAQKLLDCLRPPFMINGHELTTGACIGISMFPHDGGDPDTLIKNADTALSRAKEQGRNHYQFYTTDMNAAAFERLMLESRLRRALEQQELVIYYQPQVELEGGRIVGVEALLRWFHPDHGMVPPGEFIPLAEETGLILPIGEWVLESACRQVSEWQQRFGSALRLAVNLSARQFQQRDLVERIRELTDRLGFARSSLELELTESVVMRDAAESVRRLRELTGLGVQLALDDFGTGYSSLGYLRRFPIRALKIDRSFVHDIAQDATAAALVEAIVALGRSLRLRVVAEGVETREQLRLLRSFGCHEIQGYIFSRPVPAAELGLLLQEGRRLSFD